MSGAGKRASLRDRWRAGMPSRLRGGDGSIWGLEHAQDIVSVTAGVILVVLAAILIVSGIVSFVDTAIHTGVKQAAVNLVDVILLVLILVEIVHTVVLSLRAHRLIAQPFIVVGLIAVIRRILFLLSSQSAVRVSELALLIGMVVAFVAGLIAVSYFEKPSD